MTTQREEFKREFWRIHYPQTDYDSGSLVFNSGAARIAEVWHRKGYEAVARATTPAMSESIKETLYEALKKLRNGEYKNECESRGILPPDYSAVLIAVDRALMEAMNGKRE